MNPQCSVGVPLGDENCPPRFAGALLEWVARIEPPAVCGDLSAESVGATSRGLERRLPYTIDVGQQLRSPGRPFAAPWSTIMKPIGQRGHIVPFDPSLRPRVRRSAAGAPFARTRDREPAGVRALRVQARKEDLLALRLVLETGPESGSRE
jgi:hypothetical protein